MDDSHRLLALAIKPVAPAAGFQLFASTLATIEQTNAPLEALSMAISRARRWLGSAVLGEYGPNLSAKAGPVVTNAWSAADAGRVALTLAVHTTQTTESADFLRQVFDRCTDTETAALLRGLALFANDARHKETAALLARTNSVDVFSALASHNPYAAAYYSEHEFNQLVLKALFVGVNIDTLAGLELRTNPNLSRMCEDYYDERVAAGRSVPADIWLALLPFASPRGKNLWAEAANGTDPTQRLYAMKARQQLRSNSPNHT